ncbi:MAG: hypothetical protein F9K38_01615 [Pseudorhodoplanes sp.]|nr:MAG: hypothetical protein F9K38_01615 [Pseudorhodoplanes sp.]
MQHFLGLFCNRRHQTATTPGKKQYGDSRRCDDTLHRLRVLPAPQSNAIRRIMQKIHCRSEQAVYFQIASALAEVFSQRSFYELIDDENGRHVSRILNLEEFSNQTALA